MKNVIIKSAVSSIVFFGIGIFIISSFAALSTATSGTPLTATNWNNMVSNFFWGSGSGGIYYNGNVGIGTSTPSQKLEVNGNLKVGGELLSTDGKIIRGDGALHLLSFQGNLGDNSNPVIGSTWTNFGSSFGITLPVKGKILLSGTLVARRTNSLSSSRVAATRARLLIDGTAGGAVCYVPWDAQGNNLEFYQDCLIGFSQANSVLSAGTHTVQIQILSNNTGYTVNFNTTGEGHGFVNAIAYGYDYQQ